MINAKMAFINSWFTTKGWDPLPFQLETWWHIFAGRDGLISVPTGAGKTYAAYMAALANLHLGKKKGLQILYITPLRALAQDLSHALEDPIKEMNLPYRVEKRTGDTKASVRSKQTRDPPEILLTTPESLAIMLCDANAKSRFSTIQMVIVDEWHELLGSKRGSLMELNLARLKTITPAVQLWGLTATIGNIDEAAKVCVGNDRTPTLVIAKIPREIELETLLPENLESLPWAGRLGLRMLPYLLNKIDIKTSTLIFTNTRSQAERWHQAIVEAKPEWKKLLGLHHSSIDRKERQHIEEGLKNGELKCVISTSSLDLGVDFTPVEKVFQIGSPKSVARLLQRAGRSSHKPLTPCRLCIVPTHALEIAELKAYRLALKEHFVEKRHPRARPFDVLIQHIMSCAIGGGFSKASLFTEILTAYSYKDLGVDEFESCINFLTHGGKALGAYPEYKKLIEENGIYKVLDKKLITLHKLSMGTITSDISIPIKLAHGKPLGSVEESFIANLKIGDHFLFGGRVLELIQLRDLTAYVRISKKKPKHAAVWQGGRLPYSASLGEFIRQSLDSIDAIYPESLFLEEILNIQRKLSHVPHSNELLVERCKSREGWHLFFYPFEGRTTHEALGYILAARIAKLDSATFTISCNDYGLELLSHDAIDIFAITNALFISPDAASLEKEIQSLMNIHELSRSSFRDVARISGLVFQGYPGRHKSHRQIQVSSSLLFEVFSKYDPENVLLKQAQAETMQIMFDVQRLQTVLERLSHSRMLLADMKSFSPFAMPLYIERISGMLSTETIAQRVEKIKRSWTKK
jgi:ATP-dependent Lhr-like helicase